MHILHTEEVLPGPQTGDFAGRKRCPPYEHTPRGRGDPGSFPRSSLVLVLLLPLLLLLPRRPEDDDSVLSCRPPLVSMPVLGLLLLGIAADSSSSSGALLLAVEEVLLRVEGLRPGAVKEAVELYHQTFKKL